MKKQTFTLFAMLLMFVAASAQTVTLTFTGHDINDRYVQLDSVSVTNQTKGWSETLVWSDTVLTMQHGTGIDETVANGGFELSQNNPNPFNGITVVNLTVADAGAVTLEIADVNGKIVETHRVRPEIGTHQFRISLSATGTYVLTARQNGKTSSIKMVCNGTGNGNRIEYIGIVETRCTTSLRLKSTTTNPFTLGDEMEYVGFATINGEMMEGQRVTQAQTASETIVLAFAASVDGQSCPPTVTDIDGNVYNTVMIGTQCWMKENLRTTHYANNDTIPAGFTSDASNTDPYYYDYAESGIDLAQRGLLYNWAAVMHGATSSEANPSGVQGICPDGWHVPSNAEWIQLTDYVSSQSQYVCGNDNNNIAKSLADTSGWTERTDDNYPCEVAYNQSANNATGFSAVPVEDFNGSSYNDAGDSASFWSSTASGNGYAWCGLHLFYWNESVERYNIGMSNGYSVRCVRD